MYVLVSEKAPSSVKCFLTQATCIGTVRLVGDADAKAMVRLDVGLLKQCWKGLEKPPFEER